MSIFTDLSAPKILYEVESPYNGNIKVWQVGKVTKVVVGGFEQSLNWESKSAERLVWGTLHRVVVENAPAAKKILVLGLGGATIQHLLSHSLPDATIYSVEIDQIMYEVAQNYFALSQIPNHHVIVADACRVIVEPESFNLEKHSFDVVVVDIYVGDKYPDLGKSGNFISAVREMATEGGLVVFNRMYTEHHQDEVNNFIDTLEDSLHDVKSTIVAGRTNSDNVVIYGRA